MKATLKAWTIVAMVVLAMGIAVPAACAQSASPAGSWLLVSLTVTSHHVW